MSLISYDQLDLSHYSDQDADDLRWLHQYTHQHLGGSIQELRSEMGPKHGGKHWDLSVYPRIWRGKYAQSNDREEVTRTVANFMQHVRAMRKRVSDRVIDGFVTTPVTKQIHETMSYVAEFGYIGLITGETGRGKTEAVREWCRRNNHGRSTYLDCPALGGTAQFLRDLCKAKGLTQSHGMSIATMSNRLHSCLSYENILVLDEPQRLLPTSSSKSTPKDFEFLRRLNDKYHVGLVFVATPQFHSDLHEGKLATYFEQLVGRIEASYHIPSEPIPTNIDTGELGEIESIVRAFTPEPSSELLRQARKYSTNAGNIRTLYRLLKHASLFAKKEGNPLDHKYFRAAVKFRGELLR